jgi:hypothetical protein
MIGISSFGRRALACLGVACGCAIASWSSSASAALLFYDGFEVGANPGQYALGNVAGQSGGTGTFFNSPWIQPGGDDKLVLGNSLFVPGQTEVSLGGSLGDNDVTGCCITGRVGRTMTTPWSGRNAPEGTFYMGFLANFGTAFGTNGPHHRVMEIWNDGGLMGDGARTVQFGYSEFTGVLGPNRTMALKVKDTTTNVETTVPLIEGLSWNDDGDTHCVVMKFELSAVANGDRVSVFLDPMGPGEPALASASVGGIDWGADAIGAITQFTFTGAESAARLDEVRIATTFKEASMCDVPEPMTVGMLALGLAALAGRRRR